MAEQWRVDSEREHAAWLERWEEGRTGFHQAEVNPQLERWWPQLGLPAGSRVFVPLCGKSHDLTWLAGCGYRVVGNELSPLAIAAYYDEAGIVPARRHAGGFQLWSHGLVTIVCGDFFSLEPAVTGRLDAAYDRAALVALPADLRPRYVEKLAALLRPGAPVLLVALDYPAGEMDGPPFPVPDAEVHELAAGRFDVTVLASRMDILAANPRFAERGLSRMEETVYRLDRYR
ncbi:MAG: thiopurine S-methyltransferase [Gammaproteobacteria bacterium]